MERQVKWTSGALYLVLVGAWGGAVHAVEVVGLRIYLVRISHFKASLKKSQMFLAVPKVRRGLLTFSATSRRSF